MRNQNILISLASIIIILAGLKTAAGIVVPFLLAVFIAIVISPAVLYLEKLKIPKIFSFLIVSIFFIGVLGVLGAVVYDAVSEFATQLPDIQNKIKNLIASLIQKAHENSIEINTSSFAFDTNKFSEQASAIFKKTGSILSMSFFVFIIVAFMVFESDITKQKVEFISKNNSQASVFVADFINNLKRYLMIKTLASATTGFLIYIGLLVLNVPYAPLWGILAFVLNYIPTIGSIVAAIPTIFVSLATTDISTTLWVIGIYVFVNVLIGNIIEPRFLGEQLGISTIIVLASLLIWGFVFGIGGLFLAVPLTMSLKIALNSNQKTKILSIIMSNKVE